MHDSLRDFGPSPSFWCFPYERYNGWLKKVPTSQKSIPPSNGWEFLDKLGQWQEDSSLACIPKPPEFHANLSCKSYHIKAKDCHGVDQAGLSGTFDRLNGEWRAGRPVRFIHMCVKF